MFIDNTGSVAKIAASRGAMSEVTGTRVCTMPETCMRVTPYDLAAWMMVTLRGSGTIHTGDLARMPGVYELIPLPEGASYLEVYFFARAARACLYVVVMPLGKG